MWDPSGTRKDFEILVIEDDWIINPVQQCEHNFFRYIQYIGIVPFFID